MFKYFVASTNRDTFTFFADEIAFIYDKMTKTADISFARILTKIQPFSEKYFQLKISRAFKELETHRWLFFLIGSLIYYILFESFFGHFNRQK